VSILLNYHQCAAALYRVRPNSALFRLPALTRSDVREWMTTDYPSQLTILQAKEGSPVDLERMQNAILRRSLEELRALQAESNMQIHKLTQLIERRTQVFSPAKAYSHETYNSRGNVILLFRSLQISSTNRFAVAAISTDGNPILQPLASLSIFPETPPRLRLDPPTFIDNETRSLEDTGVYETEEDTLRGFVCPSPKSPTAPRPRTEVDLVLPPVSAFSKKGMSIDISC
jgi:hypothetical protein